MSILNIGEPDPEEERLLKRITIESGKMQGSPCIRGLRMRVSDVLGYLYAGMSWEEILDDFPDLEEKDIKASLIFAQKIVNQISHNPDRSQN